MKVIVIGTGFGERVVAPVYRRLGATVDVISPRDDDAIERACAAPVDLVSVHSPAFLHRAHVLRALDHGRPVLCDKPFGTSAEQARDMRDSARRKGLLNFLNFEFRCQPSRVRLKQLLDEGAIGTLQHISWTFIGNGLRQQKHRWLFDADLGGGWIGAYGSHAIDAMRWLFDSDVAECGGILRTETPRRPDRDGVEHASTAEDAYSAWFRMANGRTASMDTAFSAPVSLPHRIILMGSEGSLELVDEGVINLQRAGSATETIVFTPPVGDSHEPGLIPWLGHVCEAVREKRQIAPSFDDGLAAAEAMEQLRTSAVRLPIREGGDDVR